MTRPSPAEFVPLPVYNWNGDYRPETLPLSEDEAATALFLADGQVDKAAQRLMVEPKRLRKAIRRYGRLQVLLTRLAASPDDAVTGQNGKLGVGR